MKTCLIIVTSIRPYFVISFCLFPFPGTDTTTTALTCFLLILVQYPKIQKHLQSEIDDVIGSRSPLLSDRTSMPYMEACQMETLRLISHVPLAVPHATIRDTVVQGKRIPKDTVVSISVCCHSDKVVYKKLN